MEIGGFEKFWVKIGHDVWIGENAIILSRVEIGNGAVIGAGSVVTKSVPPYAVVGGNPARFIKWRFDREVIEKLEEISWYEWKLDKVLENKEYLQNVVKFDMQEYKNSWKRKKNMLDIKKEHYD